jgi:hypothetical protein
MSRSFLPLALITLGVVFLLSNFVPERGRGGLIVLGLGAAFMIGRLTTGRYGYAVPAGILLAVGAYISVQDMQGLRGIGSGGAFFVLLGLGFAVVYAIGMRPNAVWPLFPGAILICLGLVLLGVASLGPLAGLSWIAGYWPVALVLLGLWFLVRESLPTPVRRPIATIGGLALLGYGIVAGLSSVVAGSDMARAAATSDFGSSPFSNTVELNQPISAGQTFTVNNPSGHTTIRGGSGSDVHVVATRHFPFDRRNADIQLTPSADGLGLDAGTGRGGFPFGPQDRIDYVIDVPAAVEVRASAASGSLEINDVSGPVHAQATSGSVTLNGDSGPLDVSTTSGSASYEGVVSRAGQIRATSGSVHLRLLAGTAIQLDVHTTSGRVEPQGDLHLIGPNATTKRDALMGTIGAPGEGATLTVQTTSGSVTVSQ